jgi:hypothetical protein
VTAFVIGQSLAYLGFALIALAMHRHRGLWTATGDAPRRRLVALRLAGCVLLALSLVSFATADGFAFGLLLWALALTFGAVGVVFTLAWTAIVAARGDDREAHARFPEAARRRRTSQVTYDDRP